MSRFMNDVRRKDLNLFNIVPLLLSKQSCIKCVVAISSEGEVVFQQVNYSCSGTLEPNRKRKMETQECLFIGWLFFQVTVILELPNVMNLTRQLGTAGKEGLLTYWSQKIKGSLPRPGIKILMVIIQHQEMRIHLLLEGIHCHILLLGERVRC